MVYIDNNASTPVDAEVVKEMTSALTSVFGNPSSAHAIGAKARVVVEKARSRVAHLIGVSHEEIFFTSGGTESNNLAILGLAGKSRKGHIVTSLIEHPSVISPCMYLKGLGFEVTVVGVDKNGQVIPDEVRSALREDTILITIMHANNETGVFQPIEEIGAFAMEKAIPFHTDAAQTIGKIPVNAGDLDVDMMTIVSHKFYGPKGVGALYVRKGVQLAPILFGAGHERGLRPGTENVPGIAGLGKACDLARIQIEERVTHTKKITDALYSGLKSRIHDIRLNGHESLRLPNTLNVSIPGIDSLDLLEDIKERVAASSGSACHSGMRKPSSVLKAMGLSDTEALSSIRFSTGKDNTEEEIREAVEILLNALRVRGR